MMRSKKQNLICVILLGAVIYLYLMHRKLSLLSNSEIDSAPTDEDVCKSLYYTHKAVTNAGESVLTGKMFDCDASLPFLKRFGLLPSNEILDTKASLEDVVFVIAADASYYIPSRAVIAGIRKHFGKKNKIVYYDLGRTVENPTHAKEMSGICNFESRVFDWTQLSPELRPVKIFAWKIMIIAEMFKEVDTFIYLDSSIFFETGAFEPFFDLINNKSLTPFQMSGATGHSIQHATHKHMYDYLPMDPNVPPKHDMLEANMMLFHKSELTKELIKWAVLCALNKDCIEPPGAILGCTRESENSIPGLCHRQDQSIFNILLANLEQKLLYEGWPVISHIAPNHPKNTKQRHQTRRMQSTSEKIDDCKM